MSSASHTAHDVIFLTDELGDEVSWSQDSQNERDVKYLRASPVRDAAPDLLQALQAVTDHFADVMGGPQMAHVRFQNGVEGIPTIAKARAAIAKAEGK